MSDELDPAKVVGFGGGAVGIITALWAAFTRRAEKNEDRVDQDLRDTIVELKADVKKLTERIEGGLGAHKDLIASLVTKTVELETRLRFREGGYGPDPLTSPGIKPSPAVAALQAKHRGNDGD